MERVNTIFASLAIYDIEKESQDPLRSLSYRVSTMAATPSTASRPQPDTARGYSTAELPAKPSGTVSEWLQSHRQRRLLILKRVCPT